MSILFSKAYEVQTFVYIFCVVLLETPVCLESNWITYNLLYEHVNVEEWKYFIINSNKML
jgi:hypothetical protein